MSIVEQPDILAADEVRAIEALSGRYEDRRAACIEALRLVQRRHRWVSDGHLREIADLLGMTAAELDAVATFFNLIFRRPVGRHVIMLCDSISCWIMGHDRVLAQLEQSLHVRRGGTTADGRFTLLPIVCLGHCECAPVMMIDVDVHGDLDPASLEAVLEPYR